ncbi:WAT1-related protein At1g09380-like [Asparagus officinalis]|uniref:WAT1-related protein At1g09380-like n=1 Tax=Asparagus officinalis TaxID=4686 RepID=UPI00098E20A9|nr:WAT1-related protein At1g09380-like [Asparagus officinalis]
MDSPSKLEPLNAQKDAPMGTTETLNLTPKPSSSKRKPRPSKKIPTNDSPPNQSAAPRRKRKARISTAASAAGASPGNRRRTRRRLEKVIVAKQENENENELVAVGNDILKSKQQLGLVASKIEEDNAWEKIMELLLWKNVAKSTLWFGSGSIFFLSSCFSKDSNFRKSRPTLTWKILMQAFFCGLFGGALAQNLYVVNVKLTSATFATAMTNLIPAITFVMAVIFRLERLGIKSVSGQAKVLGTIVGIGGAMTLTFYKGADINLFSSKFDLFKSSLDIGGIHQQSADHVISSLLAVATCFSYAIWLIIQAKMSQAYPCHYSNTALMCLMAAVQANVYALCMDRHWDHWRLGFDVRLLTVVYVGVVASALILTVLSWCIKQKGPLYASVFNPLMLVIVAFLGSLLLDEKLHVGSIIGAVLIVIGLYMVLWGRG